MRAYMSTGAAHHPDDGSRYVCGLNVDSALGEARRILAETEPSGSDFGYRRVTDGPACCAGNTALADALRTFLER